MWAGSAARSRGRRTVRLHPLDKAVALPQLLELLRGQLQPRALDQNGEAVT